jgi:hypothetical protein
MTAIETETGAGQFSVGVFQDVAWARRGLSALKGAGFGAELLTILAKRTPEVGALIESIMGLAGELLSLPTLGEVVARGPLVAALQGSAGDLSRLGLAATMRRVGFQAHDGRIFETLSGRGGVLVAVKAESRAADALAILHSYGAGNAAIGAWTGRV